MTTRNIEAIYRLTPLQEGVLYHTLESPTADIYFQQFSCVVEELRDVPKWQAAWQLCGQRHPALRTLFTWEKREHPLQLVRRQVDIPWEILDWRELTDKDRELRFRSHRQRDRDRGFDLSQAPLLRFMLARVTESKYYFLWSFHHILLDGWSQRMLLAEALDAYRSPQGNDPGTAGSPPYVDFINWLEHRDTRLELDYWEAHLKGFEQPTHVAGRGTPPASDAAANDAGVQELELSPASQLALTRAAKAAQVTLNTMVVAAWAMVLGARCRSVDVVFGTTVSGRPADLAGSSRIAGLFINTIPLRSTLPEKGSLADWLRDVQTAQLQNREHEHCSLADIQRCSAVHPGTPLFDSIIVFENLPTDNSGGTETACPRISEPEFTEFSHYPLAILVDPGSCLKLIAVHRLARIPEAEAYGLLQQLGVVLEQFAEKVSAPVDDILLLTGSERRLVEVDWNQSRLVMPQGECIHDLFERCAERFPSLPALVNDTVQLTFDELNTNANRLAHYLISRGVVSGSVVVVFMERGVDALTAFLAILKAGGAYIPLDVDAPTARISQVLNELSPRKPLILTQEDLSRQLPQTELISICPEFEQNHIASCDGRNPGLQIDPSELAYVIYTSGSTGTPKGVMIEHRSLVNSTRARLDFYPEQPGTFLLLSSLAVDSSVAGIYWCLCSAATLVLPGRGQEREVELVGDLIHRHSVTHLLCVPSLYQLILEYNNASILASLRTVIVAGEACLPQLIHDHRDCLPDAGLYNEYGPSECTVWASVSDLGQWHPGQNVTIGRPVANTLLYVLDSRLRSVPPGMPGELYIGGAGLARGYLDNPTLTGEAFLDAATVSRPFETPDMRLYGTGDLVRYREDGQIEFLGRVDNQIKVRGYRVEPEEVEHVIGQHADVREVAVFLDEPGGKLPGLLPLEGARGTVLPARKLVACLRTVAGSGLSAGEIRQYVADRMPPPMVPQVIRCVEDFPRTRSGKIDRPSLAGHEWPEEGQGDAEKGLVLPANENEQMLADIWTEVLGIADVGIHSNFFELGGDSLLSIRVLSRARKAGMEISSADFFAHPTIAGQARLARQSTAVVVERGRARGKLDLGPIQHWFFQHIVNNPEHWNQCLLLRVRQNLDFLSLERAFQALLLHHDGLLTVFKLQNTSWCPCIIDCPSELPLRRIDLSGVAPQDLLPALERDAAEINREFDLAGGPLIRMLFAETGAGIDNRLIIAVHHLIVDAESWRILLADLDALWRGFSTGAATELPARTTSYKTWVERLREFAATPRLLDESAYWNSIIEASGGAIPLDIPGETDTNTNAHMEVVSSGLDAVETRVLLQEVPGKYNADVMDALLAGLQSSLLDWSGLDAILVDVEGHGREPLFVDVDTTRTVGWFTSVYPVRFGGPTAEPVTEALIRFKEQRRRIPNGGIGYGILRYLAVSEPGAPLLADVPCAQVCFNYLGQVDKLQFHSGSISMERDNPGSPRAATGVRPYILEINCRVSGGRLTIDFSYSNRLHWRSTIEAIASDYVAHLRKLIHACANQDYTVYSPSDFPLADIGQEELDTIGKLLSDSDDQAI